MAHLLRDGSEVTDPRLDRLKQQDPASREFPIRALLTTEEKRPRSYTWSIAPRLNQGSEGACVGFGWSHELAGRPVVVTGVTEASARAIYHEAQRIDEWPGGAFPGAEPFYEGTSVLAGAKVVKKLGLMEEYRWAFTMQDIILSVGYKGPVVIGVDWYEGMFNVDKMGFVKPEGSVAGGHCLVIKGVKVWRDDVLSAPDPDISYFTLHNSWGHSWGVDGCARMTFNDLEKLRPGGDFCVPVLRKKPS